MRLYFTHYDDPPAGAGAGAATGTGEGAGTGEGGRTPGNGGGEVKTFTQDQVNSIVAERLKAQRAEQTKLLEDLKALQKSKSLTDAERSSLTERVANLQSALETKEELLARQRKELQDELTLQVQEKSKEVDSWRNRYTTESIERNLFDSAIKHKAVNPRLICDLLKSNTRLEEVKDSDGNATGKFISITKVIGVDKNGKPVPMELPTEEAVGEMKKNIDEYGTLFLSSTGGGLGQTTLHSAGGSNVGDLKDTSNYIAQRLAGKLTLDKVGERIHA